MSNSLLQCKVNVEHSTSVVHVTNTHLPATLRRVIGWTVSDVWNDRGAFQTWVALPVETASHPRRIEFWAVPLWLSQILHVTNVYQFMKVAQCVILCLCMCACVRAKTCVHEVLWRARFSECGKNRIVFWALNSLDVSFTFNNTWVIPSGVFGVS
jgi:hypothetical protein